MGHGGRLTRRIALTVFVGIVAAGGASAAVATASVRADSVGIYSEELEPGHGADPSAVAARLHAAGIGLVRDAFSWSRIETSPGRLDFSAYDQVMLTAATAGMRVLPMLVGAPPWRSTAPAVGQAHGFYPPRDPAAMAVLAAVLVQRYGPGGTLWAAHPEVTPLPIHSWQVWNEPNVTTWWASGPDPAQYVRLLRAVSNAIRGVDPTAEIVAGGLPESAMGTPIAEFLDGMYAAGARGTFDTLAIHPYAADVAGVMGVLAAARAKLDALGDRDVPIWATEFGWATGGPPVTITTSEAAQAALLHDAIVEMQHARAALGLRGFVVFRWKDVEPNVGHPDVWALHTGVLRHDDSAKPALGALSDAVAVWNRDPGPAAPGDAATTTAASSAPVTTVGVHRRTLHIRRFVRHRRLFVRVDVPPGGANQRVHISYEALRDGRITVHARARIVGTRQRVARAMFKLPRSARSADVLRVTARQGSVRATRSLRLRRPRPRAEKPARPADVTRPLAPR